MMKFNEIFPSWDIWKKEIIDRINDDFNSPTWLGSEFEQRRIYNMLNDNFGEFEHNLRTDKLFISKCRLIYIDKYPTKFNQDNNFNNLEWDKISNEFFRNLDETESVSEIDDRLSPTSGSVNFNTDIDDLPISQVQKNKVKNRLTSKAVNLMREWRASKQANFNNTFIDFMRYFQPLFFTFNTEQINDVNDDVCMFSNNIKVVDVPYLGFENQNDIKILNQNINNVINSFNDEIDKKQNKLIAGDNITIIGDTISANGGSGGTIDAYTKQETDNLLSFKADKDYVDKGTIWLNSHLLKQIDYAKEDLTIDFKLDDEILKTNLTYEIDKKQDKLIAGDNITINNNVISSIGGTGDVSKEYVDNLDKENVKLSGNQDIDGIKTFIKSPKGPEPRDNDDLATKRYVANTIGGFKVDAYTKGESDTIINNILNGTTPHTKLYVGDILIETKGSFGYFGNTSRNMVWRAAEHRFTNKVLKEVASPNDNTDATNKKYVDDRDSSLEQRIIAIERILNIP